MLAIRFFTTSGCHLCEQAEALFRPHLISESICVEQVDIAESEQLVERYGIRIPVIMRVDTGVELGWPFDEVTLVQFIKG